MEVNKEEYPHPISKADFISKIKLNKFSNVCQTKNAIPDKSFVRPYTNKIQTSPMIKHTIVSMDVPSLSLETPSTTESEK